MDCFQDEECPAKESALLERQVLRVQRGLQ
jgi:hypothetical protein